MLIFYCGHCHRKLGAKDHQRGRTLPCTYCGKSIVVPDQSEEIAPLAPAAGPAGASGPPRPAVRPGPVVPPSLSVPPVPTHTVPGYAVPTPGQPAGYPARVSTYTVPVPTYGGPNYGAPTYAVPTPGYPAPAPPQYAAPAAPAAADAYYDPSAQAAEDVSDSPPVESAGEPSSQPAGDLDSMLMSAVAETAHHPPGSASSRPHARPHPRPRAKAGASSSRKWLYAQIGGTCLIGSVIALVLLHPWKSSSTEVAADTTPPASAKPASSTQKPADDQNDQKDQSDSSAKPEETHDNASSSAASSPASSSTTKPYGWMHEAVPPRPPPAGKLSAKEVFGRSNPAVGRVVRLGPGGREGGFGTGFFVSAEGLVVTNYHVLEGAAGAKFVTADHQELEVEGYVAAESERDLLVLQVKTTGAPFLKVWDGDPPDVGSTVFAIGNPEGLDGTLSQGLVSALRSNSFGGVEKIQISAPISHGSSGGPLLTEAGLVVGVTSSGVEDGQNLNFAVPSKEVSTLLNSPIARGDPKPISNLTPRAAVARAGIGAGIVGEGGASGEMMVQIARAIALAENGHASDALAELDRIPKEQREVWPYWLARVMIYMARGDKGLAMSACDHIRQLQPDSATPWALAGLVYLEGDHMGEAEQCFTKVIALDRESPTGYAGLVQVRLKQHKPAEAAATARKGLDAVPGDTSLLVGLGEACAATKDTTGAIDAYNRALGSDPRSSRAMIGLGRAYGAAGRTDDARATFDKVIHGDSDAGDAEMKAAKEAKDHLGRGNSGKRSP